MRVTSRQQHLLTYIALLCRPSKVPDHVKNPSRYTCYVLDEAITVGGGDRQTGVEQAELKQVSPMPLLLACTGRSC